MDNKPIAIGTDDFKEIIETGSLFIDKTLFIKELIDNTSKAICFPRPRRFGKTLNMSMINYYFNLEYKDNTLFNGLKIMEQGEKYLKEMNKYPVVSLSLKDTKFDDYEGFIDNYKEIMKTLYSKYNYLLKSDKLDETDKEDFLKIIRKQEDILLPNALAKLVGYLNKHYELKVIVLLDEYDAPILYGYEMGYYDKMITFMKQLFVTTFKDNGNLKKGIITGVSRISKENLFSDANNINVYNITDVRFSEYFGFTQEEVDEVLEEYNLSSKGVEKWYDGYLFGETKIYNPWSILKYLENPKHTLQSYWTNTGGVGLLKKLVFRMNDNSTILNDFHKLLETGRIEHLVLDIFMDLKNLKANKNTIWTLFLLTGYLTPIKFITNPNDVSLKISNLEVRENLENMAKTWLNDIKEDEIDFAEILKVGDIDKFKNSFKSIVQSGFSYYDVPKNQEGENFYHGFVMGLLYDSTNRVFDITSNRESGEGRYDLVLKPINNSTNNAYIIELKSATRLGLDKTIENSFSQIEKKGYKETVKEFNVTEIAIAYIGKKIKIETR